MGIVCRLREFIKNEMRSCSMDIGGITPLYVYRMWGGAIALDEIEKGLKEIDKKPCSVTAVLH